MPEPGRDTARGRVLALIATASIAVALIGFLTGTNPEEYEPVTAPAPAPRAPAGDVPPARSHAELERTPWGEGAEASGWLASRQVAAEAAAGDEAEGDLEAAAADRAKRRAFAGAPPVIPHPVRAGGAAECVACHADGFALGGRRASIIPHARFASCTQCHAAAAPFTVLPANAAASVGNRFAGLRSPGNGVAAYEGAPPAVPHPTWMRDQCGSCHGPGGRAGLQTPHPERRSCLQCHPTGADLGTSR